MNNNYQQPLFETHPDPQTDRPATCLGITFANDAERHAYFTVEAHETKTCQVFGRDERLRA